MRDDRVYLSHIRDALTLVRAYAANGRDYYDTHSMCRDAIVRQLEIAGEASKNVSQAYRTTNPSVPWRRLAALRDVLAHQYHAVNLDQIWSVVQENVPEVLDAISQLLTQLPPETQSGTPE